MDLRQKVRDEIDSWISYYEEDIKRVRDSSEDMFKLIDIVEEKAPALEDIILSYNTVEIRLSNLEESTLLCDLMMEDPKIGKFIRIPVSSSNGLRWGWTTNLGKATLTIYPASPSPDCIQVAESHSYITYSCKKVNQ